MADIIGVLGESTTAAVGTTTAYTVPSGKAAKVRIMWSALSHASNSTGDLTINVNGMAVASIVNITAARFVGSTRNGIIGSEQAAAYDGSTMDLTHAPAPFDFYLSAGDTVTYTVGTDALQSMNFQVVGAELDAS